MPWQQLVGYGAEAALAALAWLAARRRSYHAPFAVYAVLRFVVDPARAVLAVLRGTPGPHPLEGAARLLYHLSAAGFQALVLAVAVLAAAVMLPRARWHVLGASLAVVAGSAVVYPLGAGRPSVLVAQAGAVVVGWICAGAWLTRRERPSQTIWLTLLFLATETAVLAGPYAQEGKLSAAWPLAWAAYLGAHLAAIAIHVAWLADMRADDLRARS